MISHGDAIEPKLIYKGAEAEIYLDNWYGQLAIRKSRIAKPYRIPDLDEAIRRTRTAREATMMQEVRKLGIPVPTILHIAQESCTLIMDFVDGPTLKEDLNKLAIRDRRSRCISLGKLVGLMHEGGIIHGDMTISNVLYAGDKLFIIDFGLADFSRETEDRGVDLLLLNRALKSTHYTIHSALFKAFFKGYSTIAGKPRAKQVLKKMMEIERRGRYFERK